MFLLTTATVPDHPTIGIPALALGKKQEMSVASVQWSSLSIGQKIEGQALAKEFGLDWDTPEALDKSQILRSWRHYSVGMDPTVLQQKGEQKRTD